MNKKILITGIAAMFLMVGINGLSFLGAADGPFTLKWAVVTGIDATHVAPLAVDVTGDGICEIFMTGASSGSRGKIICVNGGTGGILWEYTPTAGLMATHHPFEIGDLDNDGTYELVGGIYGSVIALNAEDGSLFWQNTQAEANEMHSLILDTDQNNYPYVYVCSADDDHGSSGTGRIRKLRGTDGVILKEIFAWYPCHGGLSGADVDGDGDFELFMHDRSSGLGKGSQCYDADTLDLLWSRDEIWCASHLPIIIDVNGDGVLDVISLRQSSSSAGIYCLDGVTGANIPGKCQSSISGLGAHSPPPVYDIDGDGNLELITCSYSENKVFDLENWQIEATLPFSGDPPTIVNVMGDENLEILIAEEVSQVKIYDGNYQQIGTISTSSRAAVVQDIDNDGFNEIVFVSGSSGILKAYDTLAEASDPLPRTNTHHYSERNMRVGVYVPPPSGGSSPPPNNPPNTPSSPIPDDGAVAVSRYIDLRWTGGDPDVGDILQYDVYFGTISPPPQVKWDLTDTIYDPGALDYETTYYWKIIAWDTIGTSTDGPLWKFTTEQAQNLPPYQPTNASPANGSIDVYFDMDLSWTGGDPDGDPVTYDVYFGNISSPPQVSSNQTNTTYDPGIMNYNTTYYWKIIAWDNHSAFTEGPLWNFTTGINHPPYQPTNASPSNGSSGVDINVDISWTGGDPDPGDTVTYDVYFGDSNPPPQVEWNQTTTTYDPGTLDNLVTYYWQIVAWDDFNASAKGPMWEFTTAGNQPPYPPSIISGPAFGGPGINHSFSAITSDPEGDDVYYMWDWGDGNFSDWIGPFDITNPVVTGYSWNESGVYGIKVKAKDIHDEEGDWSEIFNISISKQIEINNLKPGFIYFHIFTFEKSYLFLNAFEKLGITGMISTSNSLYVNATVTEAVDSVRFEAFQILWNMSTEEWDYDMSDGADAYIPLTFGLFRITVYTYDADGNMIDTDTVDYLLLFLRSSGGGGKLGKVRQVLANRLLK